MINPSQADVLQPRAMMARAVSHTAHPRHLLSWFRLAFLLGDATAAPIGAWAAAYAGAGAPAPAEAPLASLMAGGLLVISMFFMGAYEIERLRAVGAHLERLAIILAPAAVFVACAGSQLAARLESTTSWLYAWLAIGSLMALSARAGLAVIWGRMRAAERFRRRVALVGAGPTATTMMAGLLTSAACPPVGCPVRAVGIFDDSAAPPAGMTTGAITDLEQLVAAGLIDDLVITLPWQQEERISGLVERLRPMPASLWLAATSLRHGVTAGNEASHWIGGVRCIRLARPIEGWARLVKDLTDQLLAALALLFLAPLLVVLALAIRIDSSGPIFYRQKRHGIYGRVIEVFKFRTMHIDRCDDGTAGLTRQATRGDPRITRVGRLLRRASLDELPQLINVLKGEMSLVGPRPHAISHDEHYGRLIEHYAARQSVKPGITGWAQVNGLRGETETVEKMARRVQFDLEYIESWSLGLDLTILFRTIFVGFVHPEAR